jgi:hypothetical protein
MTQRQTWYDIALPNDEIHARECPVSKYLVLAAMLAAPCAAFAGQAMSVDDGFAVASNATGEIDTVIAPMHDGGATGAIHDQGARRGVDGSDSRAQPETSAPHGVLSGHAAGSDAAASTRTHKGHARTPWQSLLPGVMK